MKNGTLFLALIILATFSCKQKTIATLAPEPVIITDLATKRIDSTLNAFVASGNIAGVSALIFEQGKEVYYNAFGYADKENKVAMERNTIVQIYSMTKPITGTALMTLYEKGKFALDDPIYQYAPEFSNMSVYTGVDKNGKVVTEPLDRPITIRDLTRHTAGFPNRGDIPGLSELLADAKPMDRQNTLSQMAEKLGKIPLWFQPR